VPPAGIVLYVRLCDRPALGVQTGPASWVKTLVEEEIAQFDWLAMGLAFRSSSPRECLDFYIMLTAKCKK
jgi:hypothetical protein